MGKHTMILYVNGDSHAAAAEAVNNHAFAEDDPKLGHLKRLPHPDNLAVSRGTILGNLCKAVFVCQAESASSNTRILRTTRDWIEKNSHEWHRTFIIIGWSTWEREEWLHNGTYYQVGSSGIDDVPAELQEKYRHFVIGTDWELKTKQAHDEIWELHQELCKKGIKHFFFNCNNDFSKIQNQQDWKQCYLDPYNPKMTYHNLLNTAGHNTVSLNSWHYNQHAHSWWARYLLNHLLKIKML